jgi:hypothetical protein
MMFQCLYFYYSPTTTMLQLVELTIFVIVLLFIEFQGSNVETRHYEHTSLSHIGKTYEFLRSSGVERMNIITIVQLRDFLRSPHMERDRGRESKAGYLADCLRLVEEGGADYDFDAVNPGTVWCVLRGIPPPAAEGAEGNQKVVPKNSGPIFFAIYSHGDCHPCAAEDSRALSLGVSPDGRFVAPVKLNPLQHEWFAHMPYPTKNKSLEDEMLSFVATAGATGAHFSSPQRYFYATQLRATLVALFLQRPDRPVIALLNFCRSGGALEFMRHPVIRDYYNANKWPLVLISSSQPEYDALVGGMWNAFFHHLCIELKSILIADVPPVALGACTRSSSSARSLAVSREPMSVLNLIAIAKASYFKQNVYALHDFVVNTAYVSSFGDPRKDTYSRDLRPLLASGSQGLPDYDGILSLQKRYREDGIVIWDTQNWHGPEVDLVSVVREAFQTKIAVPDVVFGSESIITTASLIDLLLVKVY